MRNKLLASLLVFLTPAVSTALEPAKVKLTGRVDTMAGYVKESNSYRNINPADPTSDKFHKSAIVNDSQLTLNIDGKAMTDFSYGGFIRLHTDASQATNNELTFGDKTMIYVQHEKVGRLEGGNMPGAGGLFEMDVPLFEVGTLGVDGFWSQWVGQRSKKYYTSIYPINLDSTVRSRGFEFIIAPDLPSNYSGNYYSDAPKLNFFTRPVTGLTLGLAYIPDLDSHGTITGVALKTNGPTDPDRAKNPATFKQIFSGGGTYETKFYTDYSVKVGLTGELGKAKKSMINDLKAMEVDIALKYKDFKVTSSYGNWYSSFTLKNKVPNSKRKAEYWTLAFGQEIGKFRYALGFMHSARAGGIEALASKETLPASVGPFPVVQLPILLADYGTNKLNMGTIDVDYNLAKGFTPYLGLAIFQFKESSGRAPTNLFDTHTGIFLPLGSAPSSRHTDTGYAIMGGTRIIF